MMGSAPLIVLAAGGTGGHVFPAEALAQALMDRGAHLILVTDRRGNAYGGALGGLERFRIRSGGIAGRGLVGRLAGVAELSLGTVQARGLLKRLAPRAVIGFGGYASVPTVLAAASTQIPTLIHEQNAVLGRANRVLAARVDRIASSFDRVERLPEGAEGKVVVTGMPVRPAFADVRTRAYPEPGSGTGLCVLVTGGSQGARVLAEVVPAAVARVDNPLRRKLRVSQQCRPENLAAVREAYARIDFDAELDTFFRDMPERLAASHLLIARAGASTIAEVTCVGRPAVLIPYPYATDDHQSANARTVAEGGGAWVVPEPELTADSLAARLTEVLSAPQILRDAAAAARLVGRPEAAARLADQVMTLAGSNGAGGEARSEPGRAAA